VIKRINEKKPRELVYSSSLFLWEKIKLKKNKKVLA